jgi:hypothetical protein
MDHAVFGLENELVLSNGDCNGEILFHDGSNSIKFNHPSSLLFAPSILRCVL